MNTSRNFITPFLVLLLSAGVIGILTGARNLGLRSNDFLETLETRLDAYTKAVPEDRVYLQFDKPFYKPGEDVWFSGYLRNGEDFQPSTQSEILHVELINPKGNVEKTLNIVAKEGRAMGDFHIDEGLAGGLYKIKAYTNWQKNEQGAPFFEKDLTVQAVVLPNLKMKLDFERKAFGPGSEVVASLDLFTNENLPLRDHGFSFTANVGGAQLLTDRAKTGPDGKALLRFKLPENLETSDGLLNVMIDYNGLTESVSRSIPIILNKIEMELFPEGGDLVNGIESSVAFRARNEFGKPADVKGYILNMGTGEKVTEFESYHQGMGGFSFTPQPNTNYLAIISEPKGVGKSFQLPKALSQGLVLAVDEVSKEAAAIDIGAREAGEVALVGMVRGKIFYKNVVDVKPGKNRVVVPTYNFPTGVAQFTLFDSNGIERAERLAFVNRDRQLKISIHPDKQKYLPREKVKMSIRVQDENGNPSPALLSLGVVNDQLLSFADDKSGNILSKMLLEYDLKQPVEESAFYFKDDEPKAEKGLDYLLMTSGWRRFTWKKVLDQEMPTLAYQGEHARVGGIIMDGYTGQPVENAEITLTGSANKYKTDKEGKFTIKGLDLSQPVNLMASARDYSPVSQNVIDYNENLRLYIYGTNGMMYGATKSVTTKANRGGGVRNADFMMQDPGMAPMDEAVVDMPMGINQQEVLAAREQNVRFKEAPKAEAKMKDAKVPMAAPRELEKKVMVDNLEDMQNLDLMVEEEAGEMAPDMDANFDADIQVMDERDQIFMGNKNLEAGRIAQPVAGYYRAREFAGPVYEENHSEGGAPYSPEMRTDFRSTLFWKGDLSVDASGKAEVEFFNNDEISSFRTTVEGIGSHGAIGHAEQTYFTQLPFSMNTRFPVEVATQDVVSLPITLVNNTPNPLTGKLLIKAPEGFELVSKFDANQTLPAGGKKSLFLDYKVIKKGEKDQLEVKFMAQGLQDGFTKDVTIKPQGFPVNISFAGKDQDKEYSFNLNNVVANSIEASVTAFPSVVSDLMSGIESILREPYGCFEQTSSSSYPNVMVLNYLKEQENVDPAVYTRATDLLDRGYKRLTTYETQSKGYEWFGSSPAHEGLTAYGLMQFTEMKGVNEEVDQAMIDRTAAWLMSRRDGKGGFLKNERALDSFGRASDQVTNAYIVFALTEAGYKEVRKEFDVAYKAAMQSKDAYQLALMTNASFSLGEKNLAKAALAELLKHQDANGGFSGADHSITRSGGLSLQIETSSLAIMALLKDGGMQAKALNAGVDFLVKSRNGAGGFGSTQGTILALKALTQFASFSKKTDEAGTIEVYVDGKKVMTQKYEAGQKDAIALEGLGQHLSSGNHKVRVKFVDVKNPLPYAVAVNYSTNLPPTSKECKVSLATQLATQNAKMGETVRLSATLKNITPEGLPMTMAVIGLPAGLSAQPWQLKEMQEKGIFDFYEVAGNNVVAYYRQMKPAEERTFNLDLKADVPGTYEAPASSAYLYYTAEHKFWAGLPQMRIGE
ncbi:MAG: hypothetical protein H6581_19725 [Bacteroidia bacterium]|nr:hypothetical protein [Bacteroidia bacterium]